MFCETKDVDTDIDIHMKNALSSSRKDGYRYFFIKFMDASTLIKMVLEYIVP